MKVCFIADRLSPPRTGGERCNAELLAGLREGGIEVVTIHGEKHHGILHTVPVLNVLLLLRALTIPAHTVCLVDMGFLTHCIIALTWLRYCRRCSVVGILYHYNYLTKSNPIIRYAFYLLERAVSLCCVHVLTISEYDRRMLHRVTGRTIPSDILTPPVRSGQPSLPRSRARFRMPMRFLSVGNVDQRKNLATTLQALARLSEPWRFEIAGRWVSKRLVSNLRRLAQKLGIDQRVVFHGRVDDWRLNELFEASQVFLLVSHVEGYGMVYAEAMAYGLPIVGARAGAVGEIVEDNANGFLCSPDSPDEIAAAVERLRDSELWARFSRRSLELYDKLPDTQEFRRKGVAAVSKVLAENGRGSA